MATPASKTVEKALSLFTLILEDGGARSLSALAQDTPLPLATAYRIARSLERSGFIVREQPGRYLAGSAFFNLASASSFTDVLRRVSRPYVNELARTAKQTAHVGVFESDMVTYLVKVGHGRQETISREGMQLEAYCSGVGKALLAFLPEEERRRYLAGGPFVKLTKNTIVEANRLSTCLEEVRDRGYAVDNAEMCDDLVCVAMPIRAGGRGVCAAVSLSAPSNLMNRNFLDKNLALLRTFVASLEKKLVLVPFV